VSDVDQRLPVGVGQEPADAEVAGVVDRALGSERAAFFEVLLDLRGAVMDLIAVSTPRLKILLWNRPGVRLLTRRPKITAA
jgi:hypothetical protein